LGFHFVQQQHLKVLNKNLLRQLQCNACPLYGLTTNKHRDIKPRGSTDQECVYLLGQGPGADEDQIGQFWVGKSGQFLKSNFTDSQWTNVRLNNVTRTRTSNDEEPSFEAIECCRPR
jgi:DNA polymerase